VCVCVYITTNKLKLSIYCLLYRYVVGQYPRFLRALGAKLDAFHVCVRYVLSSVCIELAHATRLSIHRLFYRYVVGQYPRFLRALGARLDAFHVCEIRLSRVCVCVRIHNLQINLN